MPGWIVRVPSAVDAGDGIAGGEVDGGAAGHADGGGVGQRVSARRGKAQRAGHDADAAGEGVDAGQRRGAEAVLLDRQPAGSGDRATVRAGRIAVQVSAEAGGVDRAGDVQRAAVGAEDRVVAQRDRPGPGAVAARAGEDRGGAEAGVGERLGGGVVDTRRARCRR